MKLNYIDQTSVADHHMVFNAAMLSVLQVVFPKHEILFYAIDSNLTSVGILLEDNFWKKLIKKSVAYPRSKSDIFFYKAINYLKKEIIRWKQFNNILRKSSSSDVIVLSITTFTSLLVFKILSKKYKIPTICILHGDLDFIYEKNNFYETINSWFHKIIFKIPAENFIYLLPTKISKENIISDNILEESEIIAIEHPYLEYVSHHISGNKNIKKTIIFGHIGSLEVNRKASHKIYYLADLCSKNVENNDVNFRAIGLSTPGIKKYKNKYVQDITGDSFMDKPNYLSRTNYEKNLIELDFALFFYPKTQYIYRASGAICDVFIYKIPIIALRHPIFEHLFSLCGAFGELCDSIEEMKDVVERFSCRDLSTDERYIEYLHNLDAINEYMNIDNIASDLTQQLYKNSLFSINL